MKQKRSNPAARRRGITIAETAIAIAIIMIVSAATASLIAATTREEKETVQFTAITQCAENALDCFRWAGDDEEFEKAIAVLGFQKTGAEGDECLYELEQSFCNVTIRTTTRNIQNVLIVLDKLEFTAKNEDGDEIYGFTYEK